MVTFIRTHSVPWLCCLILAVCLRSYSACKDLRSAKNRSPNAHYLRNYTSHTDMNQRNWDSPLETASCSLASTLWTLAVPSHTISPQPSGSFSLPGIASDERGHGAPAQNTSLKSQSNQAWGWQGHPPLSEFIVFILDPLLYPLCQFLVLAI